MTLDEIPILSISTPPVTTILLAKVEIPVTFKFPPILTFFSTPNPPSVNIEPVSLLFY